MALANDAPGGVELMDRVIRDASAVLPHAVQFGNFWLILVLMLAGDFQRARSLLPLDPGTFLSLWSSETIYWLGVLLIKTGEAQAAALLREHIIEVTGDNESNAPSIHPREVSTLLPRAVAQAGLALLNNDPAMAATAAELTRRALRVRSWQTDGYRALINLLIQEPGGEVLAPINDILASIPTRR